MSPEVYNQTAQKHNLSGNTHPDGTKTVFFFSDVYIQSDLRWKKFLPQFLMPLPATYLQKPSPTLNIRFD